MDDRVITVMQHRQMQRAATKATALRTAWRTMMLTGAGVMTGAVAAAVNGVPTGMPIVLAGVALSFVTLGVFFRLWARAVAKKCRETFNANTGGASCQVEK